MRSTQTLSFDPDTLSILYSVFDEVWDQLAATTAQAIAEPTRNAIALAILQGASDGETDAEKLARLALGRARALSSLYWMTTQSPAATLGAR